MVNLSRRQWAVGWLALVIIVGAGASIAGVRWTAFGVLLSFVAAFAPAGIMLHVWQGPPPLTVAEVMYEANSAQTAGTP